MKRNEEMVTAGCLWCSCWRTAFGGVSVHQMPHDAGAATRGSPEELGTAGGVLMGAHLWWGSRIHRSNLWNPPDSGFLLPMVQGEHFPQLLSQLCKCCWKYRDIRRSSRKRTLTGERKCFPWWQNGQDGEEQRQGIRTSGLCVGVRAVWLEHKVFSGYRGGKSSSCAGVKRNTLIGGWVGFQWGQMEVSVTTIDHPTWIPTEISLVPIP